MSSSQPREPFRTSERLAGKAAIVTGGSRGIGLAIAAALVREGVSVVATARSRAHEATAREYLSRNVATPDSVAGRYALEVADVADYAAVEAVVRSTAEKSGGLDILVNNAGVGLFGEVAAQPLDQWREMIDTNITGVFHCCRAAIPQLRRRGGGWIINISSLASKNAFAGAAGYCASKAALNAFSEALMQEVRFDDIRVSYVLPGSVHTEFGGHELAGAEWKLAPEDVARVVVDLLLHDGRSLPSRVEMRPSKPRQKS